MLEGLLSGFSVVFRELFEVVFFIFLLYTTLPQNHGLKQRFFSLLPFPVLGALAIAFFLGKIMSALVLDVFTEGILSLLTAGLIGLVLFFHKSPLPRSYNEKVVFSALFFILIREFVEILLFLFPVWQNPAVRTDIFLGAFLALLVVAGLLGFLPLLKQRKEKIILILQYLLLAFGAYLVFEGLEEVIDYFSLHEIIVWLGTLLYVGILGGMLYRAVQKKRLFS